MPAFTFTHRKINGDNFLEKEREMVLKTHMNYLNVLMHLGRTIFNENNDNILYINISIEDYSLACCCHVWFQNYFALFGGLQSPCNFEKN